MFVSPGAVAFHTPFLDIYWYGIIIAIAFVAAQILIVKTAEYEYKDKNTIDNIYEISFYALLFGIIGARLYYVLLSCDYYFANPVEIFMINKGGLSIHGGLIGGILGALFYCRKKSLSFLKYADLFALGLPIAQCIGRWGNFFNSEAFGLPTNLPWGVFIPIKNRPLEYILNEYFHPTFLYESLWDLFIFLILFFILKKKYFDKKGVLFFSYLMLYSFGRIIIEFIRTDSVLNIFAIPVAIYVSFIIFVISLYALILRFNHNQ